MPVMFALRKLRLFPLTALAALLVVAAWWISALGHALPRAASRGLVLAAAGLGALLLASWLRRLWTGGEGRSAFEGRLLLAVLGLGLAASFIGLAHEIGGLYFADEGIFLAQAQRINRGQLLKGWFIYPHLLFYLDAFALWVASHFSPVVEAAARLVYGVEGELHVAALVTRAVTGTLAALTVVPTFAIARRIAGLPAAGIAGTLIALSPIYLEVGKLNLSDVPAAFFATVALGAVASLLDRESRAGYVGAGLAAGLAAGAKYPAGTVAVAIAAVWACWRLRNLRRRAEPGDAPALAQDGQPWGLAWAALAAITAFLASTPSLLAYPRAVVSGGTDVMFGVRLYAKHGYPGVIHASNLGYYGGELLYSFGIPALALGVTGLLLVRGETRRRLIWMLPFPLLFFTLLTALQVGVRRNLMPLLPILSAVLAVGIGAWGERLAQLPALRARAPARRLAAAAVALAVLVFPASISAGHLLRAAHATTREAAAQWIRAHVPPGAQLIQEAYTPELGTANRYGSRRPRMAIRVPRTEMEDGRYDFLLLASEAYGRFLRPDREGDPALAAPAARYRALFDRYQPVQTWQPGPRRAGPEIRLYRLDPQPPVFADAAHFTAADGWLSDIALRASPAAPVVFASPGDWCLFKAYLAAGAYRVRAEGDALAGRVRVLDRANQAIAEAPFGADGTVALELPRDDKYFLYLDLEPGARLTGVVLEQRSQH